MSQVPTDESKDAMKKYEELWSKIRNLIRSITNDSYNYDYTYRKAKFHSDDDLPLTKTLNSHNMIIVVRSVFHEGNKYNPQVSKMNVSMIYKCCILIEFSLLKVLMLKDKCIKRVHLLPLLVFLR